MKNRFVPRSIQPRLQTLKVPPLSLQTSVPPPYNSVAAAADKGDNPQQGGEESDEEKATSAFNIDKLKAETKTPFRTVSGVILAIHIVFCRLGTIPPKIVQVVEDFYHYCFSLHKTGHPICT